MSRRRGSAIALNASEVVAARAMLESYSHIGICQALFYPGRNMPLLTLLTASSSSLNVVSYSFAVSHLRAAADSAEMSGFLACSLEELS